MIEKGEIIYDGPLEDIKHHFGNIRTVTLTLKDEIDEEMIKTYNDFEGLASYELKDQKLNIKFDADKLEIKNVVNYAFGDLKAQDMQISEIGIEEVVKSIMSGSEVVA